MALIRLLFDRSSRQQGERRSGGRALRSFAAFASVSVVLGAAAQACSFDLDAFDPRLASSSAAGAGGSGSGGGGAMGSSSSSASGDGGATASSSSSGASGNGGAGGGAGGSGGEGGGGPTGPCGGINLLTDDFGDGVEGIQWYWSGDPGTTITETGGEGVVTLPSNVANSRFVAFQAKRLYDLRKDAVSVEVTKVANTATSAKTFLTIAYDDQNYLELAQQSGQIVTLSTVNGNTMVYSTTPYNPVTHRHWRVREDGTNTFWETSPDGMNWTIRSQTATVNLFDFSSVRADLGAYNEGGEINPGSAHFGSVNGGGPSAGKWCPSVSLTDDFGDGKEGRAWIRSYQGPLCKHSEVGGALVVKPPTSGIDYCAYVSSSSYDMTGSSVTIQVPVMVNTATTAEAFVRLEAEGFGWLEMGESSGTIEFRKNAGGGESILASIQYKPAEHLWWRFREQAGKTYWEYSADGVMWKIGAQEASPLPVTSLDIIIGGGTFEPVASPGQAHFDNLNLPP